VSGELDRRLSALARAVELGDGRLEAGRIERARDVVGQAGKRLGLGVEATVVALAGPTGAGKSTLFNALSGSELARAGRRRPTTSEATAAVWGEGGDALLDWLEIRRRYRVADGDLDGLILLDLPDFDSVETAHRLEVERIIGLTDLVVWVVDPQKYADAAWHERYLRPLASHRETMLAALNGADLLTPAAFEACRLDLRRLLREDGLGEIPILGISALRGEGLDALRQELSKRVRARGAAVARLAADVTSAAGSLGAECGEGSPGRLRATDRERLLASLGEAASVPTVVRAVAVAHRRRGALATGWPYLRWLRRLRPDPLRRLRLSDRPDPAVHTSLPGPTAVHRSQVAAATRRLAAALAHELPPPWPGLARSAATAAEDKVADRLDQAVGGADLHVHPPLWWRVGGLLQRLLATVVFAGILWLIGLAVLDFLHLEDAVPLPELGSLPLPTVLLAGGVLAGLLLAFLAGGVNRISAQRRARAAARSLRARVEEVADDLVIGPLERELEVYEQLCEQLELAAGRERRGWGRLRRA